MRSGSKLHRVAALALAASLAARAGAQGDDPLPSWNDGPAAAVHRARERRQRGGAATGSCPRDTVIGWP